MGRPNSHPCAVCTSSRIGHSFSAPVNIWNPNQTMHTQNICRGTAKIFFYINIWLLNWSKSPTHVILRSTLQILTPNLKHNFRDNMKGDTCKSQEPNLYIHSHWKRSLLLISQEIWSWPENNDWNNGFIDYAERESGKVRSWIYGNGGDGAVVKVTCFFMVQKQWYVKLNGRVRGWVV